MSEGILKALMQLFALVAFPVNESHTRRSIIKVFLSQQLSSQLTDEYLKLYDKYLQEHEIRLKDIDKLPQRIAASSVKILKIATSVNAELTFYQKIFLLQQLIEFLNSGRNISEIEKEFINNVADTLNIDQEEYHQLFDFIIKPFDQENKAKNILTISGKQNKRDNEHFHFWENLQSEIKILHVHSSGLLMLRHSGEMDLTINGQLLLPSRVHIIRPGASIRNRRINPIFYSDILSQFISENIKTQIQFEVSDISFEFKKGKIGIHPMSFTSQSGRLVGVMGDSGSGKTTLINILCGKYTPSVGAVKINNIDIHYQPEKINGLIGYVSQDDLLIEDLTVYQNLFYNAKLCFGDLSEFQIKRKVLKLLDSLGLYDVKDMKVGNPLNKNISGGQRKRLNIALELIREPAVLFLDEPTSGLSSRDSENIIDLLKELTIKGKLIFVVIHQPSSDIFKMFNQLLVLDTGGYLIYNGDAIESINYFKQSIHHPNCDENECPTCGNVNAEQILNIISSQVLDEYGQETSARKIEPIEWYEIFLNKTGTSKPIKEISNFSLPKLTFKIPTKFKQFCTFLKRDVLSKLANTQYLLINLLETPLLAIILASIIRYYDVDAIKDQGYIFSNNPNLTVYIFMSVIISIFVGLTVSAEEIINDRKILNRESFLNLSRLSYIFSKIIILSTISAIQTFLFVLIGNSIIEIKDMYVYYWLILFSSSVFANILGLIISDTFKKTVNIYILIPFLVIPQLIFSGVFISYDRLNPNFASPNQIPWYGEITISKWAFEALAINQYTNNKYEQPFYELDKQKSQALFIKEFWYPSIKAKLYKCNGYKKKNNNEELNRALELIKYEIIKLSNSYPQLKFNNINEINSNNYSEDIYQKLILHIEKTKRLFIIIFNNADKKLDQIKQLKTSDQTKRESFLLLKNNYFNDDLERFVRNTNNFFSNKIIEYNNQLIQKVDPVFKDPEPKFILSHYLAPSKRIANTYILTYWANLIIIWIYNLLLFIILYSRLLPKIFDIGNMLRANMKKMQKKN
ncbi:MAG: ATP-binding cassette domain-containing protein [Marinilabiliaceae bacterium]|nr:ATP-binding cassette domain-containing protein [Marinilabiliaceae bacterium]